MRTLNRFFLLILIAVAGASCQTGPTVIPEDLTPEELFQQAQEASSLRRYDEALEYYQAFFERFPEDLQNGIEAEYETAFLYYKKGRLEESETRFNALLKKYEGPESQLLPKWPRVLAEKVLQKIDEEKTSGEE